MTPAIKAEHLRRCKGLLNNLKSAKANRTIIFSDEKTWTVDPTRNRRNDRFISFGDPEGQNIITTTKHPSSTMSLGFVASNGLKMPLIWFPKGYRLNSADYVEILETKLLPWIKQNFPDGNVTLQQDGAPAHTSRRTQKFLSEQKEHFRFWSKTMWPPYSPDANPLDFSFWPHVENKACRRRHPNLEALKSSVNDVWDNLNPDYIRNTSEAFHKRIEKIIDAKGGYIED